MAILNVTPDSFSDGNAYANAQQAANAADRMIDHGAAIIDVGPESTRPGANPMPASEQIGRALPVIERIRARHDAIAISIDTRLASVARAALDAGADLVNDVSALRDDAAMVDLVASRGAPVVLMHMRGTPADMQRNGGPEYENVVDEIAHFFEERITFATAAGIARERIILDPGLGFGKRVEHNLAILRNLDQFVRLGQPILVGASRKSFIGHVLDLSDPADRLSGSLACAVISTLAGAAIIRTHDVRETSQAVEMTMAMRLGDPSPSNRPAADSHG